MEKIEQIKAEIKRKYKSYEKILNENINPFLSFSLVSRIEECKSVLSFIDSLEEPKSEDLEQAAVEASKEITIPKYSNDYLHCNQSRCTKKDKCYRYWLAQEIKNTDYQYATAYAPDPEEELGDKCELFLDLEIAK